MANFKSPIAILQEFLIQEKKVPLYQELPSDLPPYSFKCCVKIDSITAFGYGHTKKGAKHNCAQEALIKTGVGKSDEIIKNFSNKFDVSPTNNIKLNQFSPSKHKCNMKNFKNPISLLQEVLIQEKKVPFYQERSSDLPEFPFKYMVTFDSITTFGYSHTKKGAKENCAQNALLKIGAGTSTSDKIINNSSSKSVVAFTNDDIGKVNKFDTDATSKSAVCLINDDIGKFNKFDTYATSKSAVCLTNGHIGKVNKFDTNTTICDKLPENEDFTVECHVREIQAKEGGSLQSIQINIRNMNLNKSD